MCSLASPLLIHMSRRGPQLLFSTASTLTDSRGETRMRRRCLLSESLVKGCDSLRGILLTPGVPHEGDPGTPLTPCLTY